MTAGFDQVQNYQHYFYFCAMQPDCPDLLPLISQSIVLLATENYMKWPPPSTLPCFPHFVKNQNTTTKKNQQKLMYLVQQSCFSNHPVESRRTVIKVSWHIQLRKRMDTPLFSTILLCRRTCI